MASVAAASFVRPSPLLWRGAAIVLGALLFSWLVALAWWMLTPATREVPLDIPAGTAARVAAGQAAEGLPRELFLRIGDTLVVRNADVEVHRIGPVWVEAGKTQRLPVTPAFFADSVLLCSLHPAGSLAVTPRARPGIEATIPVALLAGIPLAIAAGATIFVVGRLDEGSREQR